MGCHFHVHFSYLWHAFASHGLPAIAELLVKVLLPLILAVLRHVRETFLDYELHKSMIDTDNAITSSSVTVQQYPCVLHALGGHQGHSLA